MQGGATCFSEPYSLDKANRYEIIRTVGKGAFGEVHLAWDTQFRRRTHTSSSTSQRQQRQQQQQQQQHTQKCQNRSHEPRSIPSSSGSIPSPPPPPLRPNDQEEVHDQPRRCSVPGRTQSSPAPRVTHGNDSPASSSEDCVEYRGGYVALKSVATRGGDSGGGRTLSKGLFRELRALQMLDCVHVVRLLDVYPEASSVVLVLEYMPSDLAKVLDESPCPLSEADCKAYAAMLLKGLTFIHSYGLLHRDIKPSNLLLSQEGVLKIADFGQARTHSVPQLRSYSHQVGTRWYRAPELLYGTRSYGFAVDMWAAGAVIGEMLASRPLFQGRSDIDQLHKILQVTGTPTEQSWPGAADLPDFDKVCFQEMEPQQPDVIFQGASKEAADLAMGMLRLDPRSRTAAADALKHKFFLDPEPTPYRLLPHASAATASAKTSRFGGGGDGTRRPRGAAFLDEGWRDAGF